MVFPEGFRLRPSLAPRREVLFYIVATIHCTLCPLAVVSQTPPADEHWMFLTKHFLVGKAARVHRFLSAPAHRCALEAERAAARHYYTHCCAADDARGWHPPPGLLTAEQRATHLRNPLVGLFPYTAHGLLDCVARRGDDTECGATLATATRYWSPLHPDTSYEYASMAHDAIVFDMTDLDDIRYAVLAAVPAPPGIPPGLSVHGRICEQFFMHAYASLGVVYIGGATPIPVAAVETFEKLKYIEPALVSQSKFFCAVLSPRSPARSLSCFAPQLSVYFSVLMPAVLWGPRTLNLLDEEPPSTSLADVALRNLVLAAGDRAGLDMAAGALEACRDTMPYFCRSLQRSLAQHAQPDFPPQALGTLMAQAFAGEQHLRLYEAPYVRCEALAVALEHESVRRGVTMLSLASDALRGGGADLARLARALHGLPALTTVFVGDFRGVPTEDSRREAARLQRRLNRAVKDLGGRAMRDKMFYSSGYAACLAGQFICHQLLDSRMSGGD
ncbi:hypothetical protein A9K55_001272 [Cordyceps militaris]|uniref:Uncharacterized protein n=1 Tax=Cordyceps militaris TaxID=73501 RepID=A0A2H4SQL1_CORMI|nr:hypothetical protein A9K55_001272 [Cordyceps militaris]